MKRLKYDINNETYVDSESYIPYHEGQVFTNMRVVVY